MGALGLAYPIALLGVWLTLRTVGEAWWVSTVGLYLPRIVFGAPLLAVAAALFRLRMRRLLVAQAASALLVVFPIMGFVLPWPVSRDAESPTVRVFSLNADSGREGIDRIVEEIARLSPDVVLLQEVYGDETFATLLRATYPTVETSGQFVLATRFRLLRTVEPEKVPYAGQLRSARFIKYDLDTPLGPVSFYSVHPVSPRDGFTTLRGHGLRQEIETGRLFEGTTAHRLEINTGLRALQVQTFAEAARREPGPVVIAGDTNLPDSSPLLRRALSAYEDGFARSGWGFGYTFPTNKWRPWMRIDRVLASHALRFVHFEVGRAVVSDHRYVVADLQRGS